VISKEVQSILGFPDYYVDEYNATPMLNYWPILKPIIEDLEPHSVCEIGSERGITSRFLLENISSVELVHIVDPFISKETKAKYSNDSNVLLHEKTSLEFFHQGNNADLYFVDGDHNYYTVLRELQGIEKNIVDSRTPFVLLHDVSWMWGRRNMYYSPGSIDDGFECLTDTGLALEDEGIGKIGFPTGRTYAVAKKSGGPKNGVLTAIEDFIESSDRSWQYKSLPSLWGIGFLWDSEGLGDGVNKKISEYLQRLEQLKPFLGILEANRLRLLQGLNEWQNLAGNHLSERENLQAEFNHLYDTAENRLEEINNLVRLKDELYLTAESRLEEINNLVQLKDESDELAGTRMKQLKELKQEVDMLQLEKEVYTKSWLYRIWNKLQFFKGRC
jgi:hypothetical protein